MYCHELVPKEKVHVRISDDSCGTQSSIFYVPGDNNSTIHNTDTVGNNSKDSHLNMPGPAISNAFLLFWADVLGNHFRLQD